MSQPKKSIEEWQKVYAHKLNPTTKSEDVARKWLQSQDANAFTNSEEIIKNSRNFEQDFFQDIVSMANESIGGKQPAINPVYINAALNDYNYCAFSASNGLVVLGDDYFSRIFFFLSLIFLLDTQNQLSEQEQLSLRRFVHDFIYTDFINQRKFNFSDDPQSVQLLHKDPEVVEMANYFFYNILAFIFCHELGHHFLGHTQNSTFKQVGPDDTNQVEIDLHSHEDEFMADQWGCDLFLKIIYTVDPKYQYAFFKYYYPYTPVVLFSLFEHLDNWRLAAGSKINYYSHPPPDKRKTALETRFDLNADYPLCNDILTSMDWFMKV